MKDGRIVSFPPNREIRDGDITGPDWIAAIFIMAVALFAIGLVVFGAFVVVAQ